jgi:methylmalonyl-CoA mutase cobalamin-binding subunit
VLGVMAPGDANFLSLLMLLEMLRKDGVVASFSGENKSPAEICDLVKRFTPDFVFVSCVAEEGIPAAVELVKALRSISTGALIVATGPAAREHSDELIEAGCSQICASTNEARRAVRSFILQRANSRFHFGTLLPRRYARGNG